jgi:hypothetical protein
MVAPHAVDGSVCLEVWGDVVWGIPGGLGGSDAG